MLFVGIYIYNITRAVFDGDDDDEGGVVYKLSIVPL